jgi:Ca2+-binding RTX toxin-like protein
VWQRRSKRGPIAVVVVSMLLVALTAGTALGQNPITCQAGTPCNGTPGDDEIFGSEQGDTIRALDGNDRVDAYRGNDKVFGGTGDDYLIGAEDNDNVKGEAGDDYIDLAAFDISTTGAGTTTDRGTGGDGDDTFLAEDGNKDFLNCGTGDDIVESWDQGLDVLSNTCEQ